MAESSFTTVTFNVGNIKEGEKVKLKSGTSNELENILSMEMQVVNAHGKTFLAHGSNYFPIQNGQVTLKKVVAKNLAAQSTFTTLEATDKSGKKTKLEKQVK